MIQFEAFAAKNGGFDFGDVELGFGWEACGDFVEGVGFVAREEVLDGAFTGVVGGQGQAPVVKVAMEVLQVFGGGEGTFVGG